jgi:hypothetical protein
MNRDGIERGASKYGSVRNTSSVPGAAGKCTSCGGSRTETSMLTGDGTFKAALTCDHCGKSVWKPEARTNSYDNPNDAVNRKWERLDKTERQAVLQQAGLSSGLWLQELDEIHTPYAEKIAKILESRGA